MSLQIDSIVQTCTQVAQEIKDHQKNLTVHFIVHHAGQRTEALALAAQDIISHPASETAMHLLQKPRKSEDSALIGIAVARQNVFFGLASRDSLLALCTINMDQFDSIKDVRRQAYHLVWHALDAADYHSDPRNRSGNATEVIVRRRNALELASANLCADVFSVAMASFNRDREAVKRLALMRGISALHTRSLFSPEYYPYLIAADAADFAIGQLNPKVIQKKKYIQTALRLAGDVGKTYDEIALKNWLAFAEPAQDMAWRGFSEAEVLSAAINTCPNTFVRTIGYHVSELSGIKPASILRTQENYSPYADSKFNESLHNRMIDQIWQDIIAQGLKQKNALPMLHYANQQNAAITEGSVLGWCAAALQAAASAFDSAQKSGGEPESSAAREFQSRRGNTQWEDLRELSKRVIRTHRQGESVDLDDLPELARDIDGLKALRQSVAKTLSDPNFRPHPGQHNELHARPAPSGPAPGPAPESELSARPAAPVFDAPIPALGGAVRKQPPRQTGGNAASLSLEDDKE